ncbi:hypothetical protein YY60_24005 [Salmonella enterica subsp. enterica serovar Ohio]|nr:hypothetical protein [Salmonella enterica subsp. enterica serovar Ohio]EBV7114777.1 hypothetical protein [Salmonella enterica subsp. enterica serovar Ohio]
MARRSRQQWWRRCAGCRANCARWGQFGYRKLLYVKLIFYHFWFFWKRNILDVKTVMRGH